MLNKKGVYLKTKDSRDILFEMALSCFEHEYDRSKRLESKASIFIGSIGVMFTLLAGYIDMDLSKVSKCISNISIVLFILCAVIYFLAVYNYVKVFKTQQYNVLKYNTFFTKDMMLAYNDKEMKEELIKKYNEFLMIIHEINEDKADYYEIGLKFTIIGFFFSFVLMCINFLN